MPDTHTLYVCSIDQGGPPPHACKRATRALRDSGHQFEKIVFDRGHLFGLFTTGRRPRLKEISGQEKLPVLVLADGTVVSGSAQIIEWARSNPSE
jgi:glutathione S-transferase